MNVNFLCPLLTHLSTFKMENMCKFCFLILWGMGAGYGVTGTAKTRAGTKSALDMAVWTALDTERGAWKGEAYLQHGSEYCDFHSGHGEFSNTATYSDGRSVASR